MSSRVSLPLFSLPADAAENPVCFGSAELGRRLGLTARQLQWWDEQGLLPARHEGHKRLYSWRDAVLAGVIGALRKAGLGQARVQAALQTLTARGRTLELPRYLVVNWRSGRSDAVQNDRQALERMATLSERGIPSLLIDLEQIESKLGCRQHPCKIPITE
jgi:DNA-binding transcriptional MerR regulator